MFVCCRCRCKASRVSDPLRSPAALPLHGSAYGHHRHPVKSMGSDTLTQCNAQDDRLRVRGVEVGSLTQESLDPE
jgi:hypothetical protein